MCTRSRMNGWSETVLPEADTEPIPCNPPLVIGPAFNTLKVFVSMKLNQACCAILPLDCGVHTASNGPSESLPMARAFSRPLIGEGKLEP